MKYCAAVFILWTIPTSSVYAQDTVQVKAGWNIIGSVKAGTVPDVLFTDPPSIISTAFYGYSPGAGYQSTDTLGKGLGYWVKVREDGIINFNTIPAIDSCKTKAMIYQGKFYNTVKVGDQCWMAENLNVGTMVTGITNQTDNDTTEKYCYNNDPLNCALYGGLYQWNEAMQYSTTPGVQGICPTGWHIPTLVEFLQLESTVGSDGNALKVVGQGTDVGAGTNTSRFSALLAGGRDFGGGAFYGLGYGAYFWSSTEYVASSAYSLNLYDSYGYIHLDYDADEPGGLSVRCLEE